MTSDLTQILRAIDAGDPKAAADLLPLVYAELRRLAARRLAGESPDHSLAPTALVHEAYLRLVGTADPGWQNRGHFFAAAAEAMRRILVESGRRKGRVKHGSGRARLDLGDPALADGIDERIDLLALDEALAELAKDDGRKAALVRLRFFAGLTVEESAAVLNVSRATAGRWWTYARAFLDCETEGGGQG